MTFNAKVLMLQPYPTFTKVESSSWPCFMVKHGQSCLFEIVFNVLLSVNSVIYKVIEVIKSFVLPKRLLKMWFFWELKMTMFDGLTMVSYDGHNQNKMMVDHVWTMVSYDGHNQNKMMVNHVWTMVDHGRPWSGGQMFAGVKYFWHFFHDFLPWPILPHFEILSKIQDF